MPDGHRTSQNDRSMLIDRAMPSQTFSMSDP
jgi:hypothetical protein